MLGAYNALLSELATDEVTRCVQYLQMDIATFEELFLHVEKQITSVCVVF